MTTDGEHRELIPVERQRYGALAIDIKREKDVHYPMKLKNLCDCQCDCECERGVPIITAMHVHSHSTNLSTRKLPITKSNISQGFIVMMTFMTLFMSVVGAGMLSIPYLFVSTPSIIVIGVLVVVGLAMGYTAELLVRIYIATNESTYNGLALAAFGPTVSKLVSATTIFAILGACVGCLEIVRDLSPFLLELFHIETSSNPATIVLTIFIIGIYPLTLLKKLTALRFSSYVGFLASIYLVLAVVFRNHSTRSSITPNYENASLKVAHVVSVFNYAFVSHLNVIPLFVNLQHSMETQRSRMVQETTPLGWMQRIIYAMSLFCIAMYSIFGLNAISLYGENTQGNILLNLENDQVMEIPRVAVLITILFSFPLLFHPFLMLTEAFLLQILGQESYSLSQPARAIESLILLLLLVVIATVMPGIQVTFSLTGASCVTLICYVFPVLCYLRLCPNESLIRKSIAIAIGIFGIITGVVATIMVLFGIQV